MMERGSTRFEDQDRRFACEAPQGWQVDTSGQNNFIVAFVCPEEVHGLRASINVCVDHLLPLSPDEYVSLCRLQLKRAYGKPSLPVDEPRADRSNVHVFEWINRLTPVEMHVLQQLYATSAQTYIVTATAPVTTFEDHRDDFETTFASFRITNPDPR